MEKQIKVYTTALTMLVIIALTILLLVFEQYRLAFISGAGLAVCIVYLMSLIISNKDTKTVYSKEVKNILNTYANILVKSNNLIDLSKKTIIFTDNIEDLINAQVEVRKPIYYKCFPECTIFILLDGTQACVYELKANDDIESPIKELTKKHNESQDKIDFSTINKPTIVEVNGNEYKILPLEKKNLRKKSVKIGLKK